ncbi:FMN-linked oxidoreductase [Sarocladium strictum]
MAVVSDQSAVANAESGASMAKLHGRAFYESIGSPKYVVAPMVDQSEFAWRMLSRSFLPDSEKPKLLAYTPMFHARHFGNDEKYRRAHFEATRQSGSTEPWLDGNPKIDRPLFVQFCANDPDALLAAAKEAAPYCDAVDLNLGCPQGIARKGHYGAFLQEDQDLIFKLINKLHKELPVPVTAKIRLLDTKEESLAYAQNVLKAGASILTVHGRRREQKGHLTGLADWEMIKYIRDNLPPETVLFANGNILQHGDVQSLIEATGADAVMSADGNLSDPGIFAQAPAPGQEGREYWRGKDGAGGWRLDAVMRRYLDLLYKYALDQEPPVRKPLWIPGEDAAAWLAEGDQEDGDSPPAKRQKKETSTRFSDGPNMHAVKAHLFHLLRHLVSKHTDVRDDLAKSSREGMPAYERVLAEVEKRSIQGMQEYIDTDGKSFEAELEPFKEDGEVDETQSSKGTMRRCKRPWWVAQPIVRPLPSEALAKGAISLSKKDKKAKGGDESTKDQTTGEEKKAEVEGLKDDLRAKDELVSG